MRCACLVALLLPQTGLGGRSLGQRAAADALLFPWESFNEAVRLGDRERPVHVELSPAAAPSPQQIPEASGQLALLEELHQRGSSAASLETSSDRRLLLADMGHLENEYEGSRAEVDRLKTDLEQKIRQAAASQELRQQAQQAAEAAADTARHTRVLLVGVVLILVALLVWEMGAGAKFKKPPVQDQLKLGTCAIHPPLQEPAAQNSALAGGATGTRGDADVPTVCTEADQASPSTDVEVPAYGFRAAMALCEYNLATLRFVYTSKLRRELQYSMHNLQRTMEWSAEPWPLPRRLPRRAFRLSYLKAPFRNKMFWRHYVFHDWRYQFTFRNVKDVRRTVSTVLGSMTPETSCVCHFSWHFPGAPEFLEMTATDEQLRCERDLEKGLAAVRLKNQEEAERQLGWYGHSTHWNTGFKRGAV